MSKKLLFAAGIVLYVAAGISLLYGLVGVIHVAKLVYDALSLQSDALEGQAYDVVNFFATNGGVYVIYALLLAAAGLLLQNQSTALDSQEPVMVSEQEQGEGDVDELFEGKEISEPQQEEKSETKA